MKNTNHISSLLLIFAALITLSACHDEAEHLRIVQGELNLQLKAHTWTYVSLEQGTVVAEVAFADSLAQNELSQRTDWDVALAPDGLLRTNSGLSGNAQAAVAATDEDYDDAELDGTYTQLFSDTELIEVW
mgnify:CR=1 FL=1